MRIARRCAHRRNADGGCARAPAGHGDRPRSAAAGEPAPGLPTARASRPRRHDRPARVAHRRASSSWSRRRIEMVLRLVPGRPPTRRAAPPGPSALGGRAIPSRRQAGIRARRLPGTDLAGAPSPPGPGRPHLVLRPPPRRRPDRGRLPPPRATCPPRVVTSSLPCSSPSPARPARLRSRCPRAPQLAAHTPARPLRRRQSSANPVRLLTPREWYRRTRGRLHRPAELRQLLFHLTNLLVAPLDRRLALRLYLLLTTHQLQPLVAAQDAQIVALHR